MLNRKQPKSEREGINIFFSVADSSMTVHCFDEDGEMSIVIRDGKSKAVYNMTEWEVKKLKKWINTNLTLNK